MKTEQISIYPPFIKLDQLLKFAGATGTGGEAKEFIEENEVFVNGEICKQRGRKIKPGDVVELPGHRLEVIERADS